MLPPCNIFLHGEQDIQHASLLSPLQSRCSIEGEHHDTYYNCVGQFNGQYYNTYLFELQQSCTSLQLKCSPSLYIIVCYFLGNAGNTFSSEQTHLCNIVTGHTGNLSSVESHIVENKP